MSSISAAREVALLIASRGDMPSETMRENSCAIGSVQGIPPMSVPNTILTPACSALGNDTSCTAARLRVGVAVGVVAGTQLVLMRCWGGAVPRSWLGLLREGRVPQRGPVLEGVTPAVRGATRADPAIGVAGDFLTPAVGLIHDGLE